MATLPPSVDAESEDGRALSLASRLVLARIMRYA
jgi:hypothetical protein